VSAILLALGASVAWGTSDFLGGVAAREVRLILVVAGSQLFGLGCCSGFSPAALGGRAGADLFALRRGP
jgi:hypothetical protein